MMQRELAIGEEGAWWGNAPHYPIVEKPFVAEAALCAAPRGIAL